MTPALGAEAPPLHSRRAPPQPAVRSSTDADLEAATSAAATDESAPSEPALPTVTGTDNIGKPARPRGRRMKRGIGPVAGSLLLHVAALGVLAHEFASDRTDWILPMHRGTNSIELMASVATPPPTAEPEVTIERPETPPPKAQPSDVALPEIIPSPTALAQAETMPDLPGPKFTELPEERRQAPTPPAATKAELETPDEAAAQPVEQPKRKPKPVRQAVPRETLTPSITEESVASAASVADSGAVSDQPPALVRKVEAIYPPESDRAREQGVVKVRVRVDDYGTVVSATLEKSSGYPRLDQAALDAIYGHQFAPANGNKKGRAAEFIWPFTFRLPTPPVRR